MPVVPATREAEAEGSLESGRLRLQSKNPIERKKKRKRREERREETQGEKKRKLERKENKNSGHQFTLP